MKQKIVSLVLIAVLSLSGCGNSSGDSSSTPTNNTEITENDSSISSGTYDIKRCD